MFLEEDRLLAILPEGHPLSAQERVPLAALCEEPFLLLEKGACLLYTSQAKDGQFHIQCRKD